MLKVLHRKINEVINVLESNTQKKPYHCLTNVHHCGSVGQVKIPGMWSKSGIST